MPAAEFLAASQKIEDDFRAGPRYHGSAVEFMAWSMHAMEALPRMREALEVVLELTRQVDGLSKRQDGVPNEEYQAGARHAVREVVARIESALAENGGKK